MNRIKYSVLRLCWMIIFFLAVMPACKDDFKSSIPYVRVNMNISITNNNGLTVPANPVYLSGGFGGIVVIYTGFSYYAYDGACPYEIDYNCRMEADGEVVAVCPCCGTNYQLLEGGYAFNGPSAEPLQQYKVTRSGDRLLITNR